MTNPLNSFRGFVITCAYLVCMNPKKPRTPCLACNKEPKCYRNKYCSNTCQQEYQYRVYIQKWKEGEIVGLQRLGIVSVQVKKYLRSKYGNKCCVCGWAEVNPFTRRVPLVADHIDGNWQNNTEANLRLICPNCDSLSTTYAALNKGKGRPHRQPSLRAISARARSS